MNVFATAALARRFELAAALGLANEARDHRETISRALPDLVHALAALKEAGVDVKELAQLAHDEIEKRDAALCKTIDQAGEYHEPRDMSELSELT